MVDRRLAYADRFVYEIEEIVDTAINIDSDVASFDDQTTQKQLTVSWSQEQYTRILSALLVGAELAYPYQAQQILYDFLKVSNGGGLSCEDVADCIETSEEVLAALLEQLRANGFAPDTNSADASEIVPIPDEQQTESMLPDGFDCSSPAANMAIGVAVVREINENVMDVLQIIELFTNPTELVTTTTDGIPIISTVDNAVEFADWLLETFTEVYQAAYTDESEKDLACGIFCHLETECSLSLTELINVYRSFVTLDVPETDDLQELITFFASAVITVNTAGVAAIHLLILEVLRFGGKFFDLVGWNMLANVIKTAATYQDFSYVDCDECPPTETVRNYWRIFQNANTGAGEFEVDTSGSFGNFIGDGWRSAIAVGTTSPVRVGEKDFGAQYSVYGLGMVFQARGFNGSGADAASALTYSAANWVTNTGAPYSASGFTAAADINDNKVGWIAAPTPAATIRSVQFRVQVNGIGVMPTNFAKVWQVVIIGAKGAGDTKPDNAHWWKDTAPATVAEMWDNPT